MIARVLVGFTTSRPIIVDEHASMVLVAGDTEHECTLTALHIVCARPSVEMPTSARIVDLLEL